MAVGVGTVIAYIAVTIVLFLALTQAIILFAVTLGGIHKYFFMRELNLPERYGRGSWVVITGASSGQGKQYALKFAKRGFNLMLIGSARSQGTINEIKHLYPDVKTKLIVKDFGNAHDEGFFDDIEREVKQRDVSILVNNVAARTGALQSHQQNEKEVRRTMACSTLVQVRMTQIVMPQLLARRKRGLHAAVIFTTVSIFVFVQACCCLSSNTQTHTREQAFCVAPNFGINVGGDPFLSIPHLSVYEASNAFRFFHANSIITEYQESGVDMMNVTPAAVVTENTHEFLSNTMGAVTASSFVDCIIKQLGQVQGVTFGSYRHSASGYLASMAPWMKAPILSKTGRDIAIWHSANPRSYEVQATSTEA